MKHKTCKLRRARKPIKTAIKLAQMVAKIKLVAACNLLLLQLIQVQLAASMFHVLWQ
jgi:hypothetical protein